MVKKQYPNNNTSVLKKLEKIDKRLDKIEQSLAISSWTTVLIFGIAVMFSFMQLYDTNGDPIYLLLVIGAFIGVIISYWRVRIIRKEIVF